MRGEIDPQPSMFSYVDLESRIPGDHPIRKIRRIMDEALSELEPAFAEMYSDRGCVFRRCRSIVPIQAGPRFRAMSVQCDAEVGQYS